MKKIMVSLILLFTVISGFAQAPKPVKLDSLVSVSLPAGYQKKDTTNEQIYTVDGAYGYMIAIREPNARDNAPLKQKKDLNKALKAYIAGIKGEQEGASAQNVRDTTIGGLTAKVFTLKSGDEGNVSYRNFLLLYTKDVTYTFEYVYPANRVDVVKDEYKNFVSSIKLSPGLDWHDQYLSDANGLSTINKIEIFGGGGIVLILIIVLLARRRRPALS